MPVVELELALELAPGVGRKVVVEDMEEVVVSHVPVVDSNDLPESRDTSAKSFFGSNVSDSCAKLASHLKISKLVPASVGFLIQGLNTCDDI